MTEVNIQLPDTVYTVIWLDKSSSSYPIMSLYCHMTGEVIIQLPGFCLYSVIWLEKSPSSYPDTVSILTYDRRSHHPATRSCLYSVIWQEKSSSTYPIISLYCHITGEVIIQLPDHVSILSYDRSHHPATQILSLYCHMTGEVIIQLPDHVSILSYDWRSHHPATRSCLYTVIWQKSTSSYQLLSILSYDWISHHPATRSCLYTVIWQEKSSSSNPNHFYTDIWQENSSSSYTDTVSILTYDRRSHHPATRSCFYTVIWQEKSSSSYPIMSLYCNMTGEVIIQLPRSCLYCHMTGEVIIQLPGYCFYTDIWQEKSSSSYPDTVSILLNNRRSHHPATRSCLYTVI
jgi:hypothetical protein